MLQVEAAFQLLVHRSERTVTDTDRTGNDSSATTESKAGDQETLKAKVNSNEYNHSDVFICHGKNLCVC